MQHGPPNSPWVRPQGRFGADKAHLPDHGQWPDKPSEDSYSWQPDLLGDEAHHQDHGPSQSHDQDKTREHWITDHHNQLEGQQDPNRPYRFPTARKTSHWAWLTATLCAILWTIIIIGGLAVLVVYLLFRPKSPRFEISSVTLNGAYLDTGTLLNADLTILANFTNPNHRIDVTFRYAAVDLYFRGTLIATQGVDRFAERAGESALRSIHMVSSEVALSREQAKEWSKEVGTPDGVKMEVRGSFLTTSDFVGTFLRLSYSLYGHCKVAVSGPPSGVLLSSNCTTRR